MLRVVSGLEEKVLRQHDIMRFGPSVERTTSELIKSQSSFVQVMSLIASSTHLNLW